MATQHRSVWEIRFHAMGEYLKMEKEMLERKLIEIALNLEDFGIEEETGIDGIKTKLKQIEKFQDRFKTFETRNANRFFLLRDH